MNPIVKIVIAVSLFCIILHYGVSGILASTNRQNNTPGIVERSSLLRAADVLFEIPANCDTDGIVLALLPVKYLQDSPGINGFGITELQVSVTGYHRGNRDSLSLFAQTNGQTRCHAHADAVATPTRPANVVLSSTQSAEERPGNLLL